jgi:hypothetical protein
MTRCSTGCLTGVGEASRANRLQTPPRSVTGFTGAVPGAAHDGSWSSVLLRDLSSAPEVDDIEVPPCPDQTIVLVVSGGKRIEARADG